MSDRRSENRNPCYLRADIVVNMHSDPVPAEAHDISEKGLRLVVPDSKPIPDEFMISIPRRKLREIVRVVRREDKELGVVFKGAITAP
ncbi:MAG: hypothetical protein FD175_242 [Beijerinckiaceae bacterium]|nr:MAG: hypothetical protein FD175_242 [Beijerinckiaceae bacterium]